MLVFRTGAFYNNFAVYSQDQAAYSCGFSFDSSKVDIVLAGTRANLVILTDNAVSRDFWFILIHRSFPRLPFLAQGQSFLGSNF